MRSASARGVAAAALAALATAVPAGGAVLGSAGRPAAAEPPGWVGGAFRTATGDSVTVYVSSTYTPEQVVPQQWAEFFAGIPHGSELGSVVVRIAPPDEVAALCGGDALGCYDARELVMPGSPYDGVAPEHVARHEYGHHIAAHRSNPPWRAADWGPKRWATAARVCTRSEQRTAFPGDDGTHYRLDPGEAFAESYRVLAERKAGAALATWGLVDGSFYPDQAALHAVEQDVADAVDALDHDADECAIPDRRPTTPPRLRRHPARRRADRRAEAAAGAARHPRAPRARRARARSRSLVGDAHAATQLRRLRPTQTLPACDLGRDAGSLRSDARPALTRWRSPPAPQRWRC